VNKETSINSISSQTKTIMFMAHEIITLEDLQQSSSIIGRLKKG